MRRHVVVTLAMLVALAGGRSAHAHGMRSAYIEITQTEATRARIAIRGMASVTGIELVAASPCTIAASPETGTWLSCPERIVDASLTVEGMGPIVSDAVIFVTLLDGTTTSTCVTPGSPTWTIPDATETGLVAVAARYVGLGIRHIATGADHLLFLLALVLCLRTFRAVMLAETAFTLSHTLSFSASALGWVHVSAAAAEACIAVSLILVALDVGWPLRDAPWKTAGLAFAFGLVHGLGFAGGLAEIGLPSTAVPAALAGFASGVEIGQVGFLVIAVSAVKLAQRVPAIGRIAVQTGAYVVGGVGCYWLIERLGALG